MLRRCIRSLSGISTSIFEHSQKGNEHPKVSGGRAGIL